MQLAVRVAQGSGAAMGSALVALRSTQMANIVALAQAAMLLSAAVDAHFKAALHKVLGAVATYSRSAVSGAAKAGVKMTAAAAHVSKAYAAGAELMVSEMRTHFNEALVL